jgi:tetratricopeptide (TPR) repeat protein
MTRTEEAKWILDETRSSVERKDHRRVVELCDKLLSEYSDLINVSIVQENRAAALCEIGQFDEAETVFRWFLHSHKQLGLSISGTTWMYHWLICYYKGDKRKAMDQFVALDELKAVAFLDRGEEQKRDQTSTLPHPADISPCIQELGKASANWYDAYKAIEAAGESAIKYLLPLIHSENYRLRGRALDLLAKIGNAETLEPLRRAAVISERDFRAIIEVPCGTTANVDGVDLQVRDMLDEYRRWADKAYKAVRMRAKPTSSDHSGN